MKKAMALLLACSMVLAFAACSKKQYTEQEVTAVVDVTDENGKTVTDKDGKAQTRVVTIPQTDAKGNTVAAGESAADGKSAGNGGSAAKDGKTGTTAKSGKDKTEKATKKNETATKKTTTTTTTVAANRKIHISVSLPAGTDTRTDKLRITINGKQVDEKEDPGDRQYLYLHHGEKVPGGCKGAGGAGTYEKERQSHSEKRHGHRQIQF